MDKSGAGPAQPISTLLEEKRRFPPPGGFSHQANIHDPAVYERARQDPDSFWEGFARELIWHRPWHQVLQWDPPHAQWFLGGHTNLSHNCLDRHLPHRADKPALLWEGEPGDSRSLTYGELHQEVCRFANLLTDLGVGKGDRVSLYMPLIPEAVIAMLACARIGAVHNVVFSGFSPEALQERINNAGSRILVTVDGAYRRGQLLELKEATDKVLADCPSVEKVVVVRRAGKGAPMTPGRDLWWDEGVAGVSTQCPSTPLDSEDMLFILYTSGTTGKPKGVVHTTGGYMVGVYATTRWVLDMKEDDVYWCTADIGWITGHSYVVYGPLLCGATTVIYEGAPDYHARDRMWRIIEKYRVSVFYTAPTVVRAAISWGREWLHERDLSSLRLLGSVGEPINPEAWMWYWEKVGGGRCPIVDTWWQTETGMIMLTPLPGLTELKPGSATLPFPGVEAEVVDEQGQPLPHGQGGYLVVTRPWPAMLRTIYGNPKRYIQAYWNRFPGIYFTGDSARKDEDGYIWVLGRADDVLNIAGHRLSTMEVESALVAHPAVAEAAAIGRSHPIKGEVLVCFVTVKVGTDGPVNLEAPLKDYISDKISPIARPDQIVFTAELPKTQSGKIMRRLLRDIAEGRAVGDVSTLSDPSTILTLQEKYKGAA
ncbi:MAG: acetate--CoA ligase [Dehalococcoidia bacterium]|nr:acetate--CoA ligase [Dehalococcoidia bacterium]